MIMITVPASYRINPLDQHFCGDCRQKSKLGKCQVFFEEMQEDLINNDFRRLPACIKAEAETGEPCS